MTNRERILALIRAEPGLTDSEIRKRTGIEPHQQVNQICRSFAAAGITTRSKGPQGQIVNHPGSAEVAPLESAATRRQPPPSPGRRSQPARTSVRTPGLPAVRFNECLFVLPCSGAKTPGGAARSGRSVVDTLPHHLADELVSRRKRNAEAASVDESALLPAVERYGGHLYNEGRSAIRTLLDRRSRVVIVSGGYGLVLPDEAIGDYGCVFRPKMWPDRLIERCLASFAEESGATHVVGVMSATTNYAKVFRRTTWPSTVESVHLATPESVGGAMVKAPRAQGQALATIAETGALPPDWVSSDGLALEVKRLDVS